MNGPDEVGPPIVASVPNDEAVPTEPTELPWPTGPTESVVSRGRTLPAVPITPSSAGRKRWLLRAALAIVVAVLALVGSWVLLRAGVQVDTWPAFLPDAGSTSITRYSGPWISAAAAALLLAGLLLLLGSVDLVRYRRSARLSE